MYLAMVPFFPANRAVYNIEELQPGFDTLIKLYPELAKCMGCNTCTKSCPMDIPVMEYISAALRGDVEKVAEISLPCVMCGICTSRCPAELGQYNIAMLCRRLTGRHLRPEASHVHEMVERVDSGRYDEMIKELMGADLETLRKLYVEREMEGHTADEMWEPEEKQFL
jgi:heterodisulfide reductase subunit C